MNHLLFYGKVNVKQPMVLVLSVILVSYWSMKINIMSKFLPIVSFGSIGICALLFLKQVQLFLAAALKKHGKLQCKYVTT